jgi:hypothetical protein
MATGDKQREDAMTATTTPRRRPWRARSLAALALAAVLTAAMTTLAVASSTTGPRQALSPAARAQLLHRAPATGATAMMSRPAHAVQIPRTLVGTQLSWLLGEFNGGSATITEAELKAHFSARFLHVVRAREMILFLRQSSNLEGSAVVTGFPGRPAPHSTMALIQAPAHRRYVVHLTIEGRSRHLITSLTIDTATGS